MTEGSWRAVASPTFAYTSFALWGWQLRWKGCSGAQLCWVRGEFLQLLSNPVSCIVHRRFNSVRTTSKALWSLCCVLHWNATRLFEQRHEDLRILRPSRLYYKLPLILKRGEEREIDSLLSVFFAPVLKTLNLRPTSNKNQIIIFP